MKGNERGMLGHVVAAYLDTYIYFSMDQVTLTGTGLLKNILLVFLNIIYIKMHFYLEAGILCKEEEVYIGYLINLDL